MPPELRPGVDPDDLNSRSAALDVIAIFAELLPVLAALRLGRALPTAPRLVALWWLIGFVQDCAMWWLGAHHQRNVWINHVTLPITTGILLWAFSLWQAGDLARMAFRIAIPLYAVVWLGLQIWVERMDRFSSFASPISGLLIMCVAAWTLVTLSLRSTEPVWRQDWLWIGSGFLLYFGTEAVLMPLSNVLFAMRPELRLLYQLFSGVGLVATLVVTGGILCARPLPSSGGSSWQRHSWQES